MSGAAESLRVNADFSWVRNPPGSRHAPWSEHGTLVYIKTGHPAAAGAA